MSDERPPAALTVVATPIGNLEDITLRALRALRECDVILAEDTRRTRALLTAHHIERPVERLDEHTERERAEALLARMRDGTRMALVSDAGTPLVSDPGAALVRAAIDAGLVIEALPGASAPLVALVLSGLGGDGFRFVGFVPREGHARRAALTAMERDPLPTVFFESPERVETTLRDLVGVCGPGRRVAVTRELTKRYEDCLRGTLVEVIDRAREGIRGEVTVVLSGATETETLDATDAIDRALDAAMSAGMKPSDAAREVARALGLKRADVYARAVERARRP